MIVMELSCIVNTFIFLFCIIRSPVFRSALFHVSAVDARACSIKRQPVKHLFDVRIPEYPIVLAGALHIREVNTVFVEEIAEIAVCGDEAVLRAAAQVHFR